MKLKLKTSHRSISKSEMKRINYDQKTNDIYSQEELRQQQNENKKKKRKR